MIRRSANFIIVKEKSQLSNNKVTIAPCPMSSNGTSAFMLLHSGIQEVSELRGMKKTGAQIGIGKQRKMYGRCYFGPRKVGWVQVVVLGRHGEIDERGGKKVEHISSREMKIGKIIQ